MSPLIFILILQGKSDFWFVNASIYYALIIHNFTKSLWCDLSFKLAIVIVVDCNSSRPLEMHSFWLKRSKVLTFMVSASGFFFFFLHQKRRCKSGSTYNTHTVSSYASSITQGVMELYAIIPYPKWLNVTLFISHMTMSWFLNDSQDKIFHESPMIFPN